MKEKLKSGVKHPMSDIEHGKYVVYGTKQNLFDLSYVFEDSLFYSNTSDIDELGQMIEDGYKVLLCGEDKNAAYESLSQKYSKEFLIYDDELIDTLNFQIKKSIENRRMLIWGTGFWSERFIEWLDDDITVDGFIDSDSKKWGCFKGLWNIFSPREIKQDDFIVIATNNVHFLEIALYLEDFGFPKDQYISVHSVMDDVAGYFREVFCDENYYPVICGMRDDHVRITGEGKVCTCCLAPESVYGNIYYDDFKSIWNSTRARIARLALDRQSYTWCSKKRCNYLTGTLKGKRLTTQDLMRQPIKEYPESIAPEIDITCNLYCGSCRNERIIDNTNERDVFTDTIIKKIIPLPVRVIINTVGEPLASRNCLRVIRSDEMRRNGRLALYTNGTLLTQKMIDELVKGMGSIELSISIDAASKDTYEMLRRGGSFNELLRNLYYIAEKRKVNKVSYLQLNFTVQRDNIAELDEFCSMAKKLGADMVVLQAIENWGNMSNEQYSEKSVTDISGELKQEYRSFFSDELLHDDRVNFGNLSRTLGVVPKSLYML